MFIIIRLITFPSNVPNLSISSKHKTEILQPFFLLSLRLHIGFRLSPIWQCKVICQIGWLCLGVCILISPEYGSQLSGYKFIRSTYPTDQRLIQDTQTPKRITDESNISLNYREGCSFQYGWNMSIFRTFPSQNQIISKTELVIRKYLWQ